MGLGNVFYFSDNHRIGRRVGVVNELKQRLACNILNEIDSAFEKENVLSTEHADSIALSIYNSLKKINYHDAYQNFSAKGMRYTEMHKKWVHVYCVEIFGEGLIIEIAAKGFRL